VKRTAQGSLAPVEHVSTRGKIPRHFAIDPTGKYLFAANQDSGEVVLFRIHRKTGKLNFAGTVLKTATPVCIIFAPLMTALMILYVTRKIPRAAG
jgi:6-phosphogluconolactonase